MRRNRRQGASIWLAGTAAILALAALSVSARAAEPQPASFSPPSSQLLLTRTLHRPLPDGNAVVTRRSYEVRILRDGEGFRVEGRLVDSQVDAPPSLRALADIERRRTENGLFPIMLDAKGMIVDGSGPVPDGSLDRAAAVTSRQIAGSGLPVVDTIQAQAFVEQLRFRSSRSPWPADIFHPLPGKRSEARSISLPGGGEGRVTTEIEAQQDGRSGQIAALARVVTTDLAGDRRVTREEWELRKMSDFTGR